LGITAVLVTHDQEEALTMADRVVIMRGGRLEQVGTPEEIYSHPASRFVASFIGTSNFLRGTVVERSGGMLKVRLSSGGQVKVPWPDDGRKDVLISVRPEAVGLTTLDRTAPEEGAPATVRQIVYRGQTTHVHMRLEDGEPFVAFLPNRQGETAGQAFAVGDRVWASWAPQSNWLVSDS
jgi:putative spermidine/putrescine transport system ATP-binding protein